MIFHLDATLKEERERYRLKLCCEDCAFFDSRERGSCIHGFPTERYREASLRDGEPMYFCKEFSLV